MRCACFQWEDGKSPTEPTNGPEERPISWAAVACCFPGVRPQLWGFARKPAGFPMSPVCTRKGGCFPRGAHTAFFAFVSCIRAERKEQGLAAKGLPGPVAFQKPANGEPGLGHPLRQPYSALGSRSTKMALETKKPLGVKRQTPFS